MSFKKDGETKVFVPKKAGNKEASEQSMIRYTVDDLVKDSDKESDSESEEEDQGDVSR